MPCDKALATLRVLTAQYIYTGNAHHSLAHTKAGDVPWGERVYLESTAQIHGLMQVHGQIHGLVEQQEHAARALQLSTTVHALELAKLCTGNVHYSALRQGQGVTSPAPRA
jgi:hypothetical protein